MRRSLPTLACAIAAISAALAIAAVVLNAVAESEGTEHPFTAAFYVPFVLEIVVPTAIGALIAVQRPGVRVAWILLLGSGSVAVVMACDAASSLLLHHDRASTFGAWAAVIAGVWPVLFLWPLALAWTYPEGRLPTGRWRRAANVPIVACTGIVLLLLINPKLDTKVGELQSPLQLGIDENALVAVFWVFWFGMLFSLFGGAALLVAKYRRGEPDLRRQILWLAYGAVLLPLWLGGTSVMAEFGVSTNAADGFGLAILQAWPAVAVWVAVTRHGLYSIDRLLNRTLVYLAVTAVLGAAYALVSLAVGNLAADSALTASAATLVAAALFLPVRSRLQTIVDRRFARARYDAARTLRDFLDDVREGRAEPEDVGAAVAFALGDPTAEVLFQLPESDRYADRRGHVLDHLPDDGRARSAVVRGDRPVGILLHAATPAVEPELLATVLGEAAVPVELARLRVELRLQLAEVESSRARIAEAGYAERRRIERDLHDGAQQRLVTLGIVLRRMQRSLPKEAQVLRPAFDSAVGELTNAIDDLRTLAAGVRPPRLDEGLAAALNDLASGAALPVSVTASPERAPSAVEATAYFVACEALTNAVKHASPTRVVVETSQTAQVLRMFIADDGVGGAGGGHSGTGLAGMRDRVAAHGGTITIESPAGAGTRIAVELPCAS